MKYKQDREEFREEYRLLGLRIAYYRKRKGWTQEQLAEKSECSWISIGQIEANSGEKIHAPSLYMLFRIAKALEVPIAKLFED